MQTDDDKMIKLKASSFGSFQRRCCGFPRRAKYFFSSMLYPLGVAIESETREIERPREKEHNAECMQSFSNVEKRDHCSCCAVHTKLKLFPFIGRGNSNPLEGVVVS